MAKTQARSPKNYRIGIDVGTHSVGLAAIEFDDLGRPTGILSAVSHLHDAGVLEEKQNTTRLAASGVARRTRRLIRRRRKRLKLLEQKIVQWGWSEPSASMDPYVAWRARARLASQPISDPDELGQALVRAVRHMARHRGWRNPYHSSAALLVARPPSEQFTAFRERVESALGRPYSTGATVAELAVAAIEHDRRPLRIGKTEHRREDRTADSYLGGKLMQQDNANEIHAWATRQGLDAELVNEIIETVFMAESPKGSWIRHVGKDPLDGATRAPKASDTFQRFNILTTLANVRVSNDGGVRPLSLTERTRVYEYLVNLSPGQQPTWADVAKVIDLTRGDFKGVASLHDGEERLPQRPPIMVTDSRIQDAAKPLAPLRDWWQGADRESRDALILLLVDGIEDEDTEAGAVAHEVILGLDEDALSALDGLDLPAGRAAYSLVTMAKIIDFLLGHDGDLHLSRRVLFDIPDDWTPPAEPVNSPVGNPTVDRTLRIVGRYLDAAEQEWGTPSVVVLEHVREAFVSAATVAERDREMRRRMEANELQRQRVKAGENDGARTTIADVRRYDAIMRQKCQCLYCGDTITFKTSELDHIVPRKGVGSTNTRSNLAAVCMACNRSKGGATFSRWALQSERPQVSVEAAVSRLKFWTKDKGASPKSWSRFLAEVRERLERTDADPEIDARSMESVAWMANELRGRIAAKHGPSTKVLVYQGSLTAGAREAAGIAQRIPFIGGQGKTRFDRRHHAVDAAVVTLLDASVARTLAERNSLRASRFYAPRSEQENWKTYSGHSPTAQRRFDEWRGSMATLADLLGSAFADDRVVVTEALRLRLGDGRVHEDTVRPLVFRPVSSALTRDEIDAASGVGLWHALTRDPDFGPSEGLPANPNRRLRVHGTHYGPDDMVGFFGDSAKDAIQPKAALAVRGGWAALGDSIHHARIYRWTEKGKTKWGMLRVFAADLYQHRHEDLFSIPPNPSWISMRNAHPSIGRGDFSHKEYVGWIVAGDELRVSVTGRLATGHVGRAIRALELDQPSMWTVTGFTDGTKLAVVPSLLAGEGLARLLELRPELNDVHESIKVVLQRWRPSVQVLFEHGEVEVVRRDVLGRRRMTSRAHLPVCWVPE